MSVTLLLSLAFIAVFAKEPLVLTPYGYRHPDCVLEVPNGATVRPSPQNPQMLEILQADGLGTYYHNVPAHCANDIAQIKEKSLRRTPPATNVGSTNGWLDYGGWYPPQGQNNLNSFTSTYVVPGNPPTQSPQVLFYFIGMQDNDAPNAVNIIQPVLTWGNGYTQWYLASWACCPSNITVHSPYLFGLSAGSTAYGTINRVSDSTWSIDSVFNGKHTTLNAQVGDYIYNWADVTLEVYSVSDCSQFAPGRASFNDLVLKDKQGQTLNPNWQFTGATVCGGTIRQTSSTSIYIQHTN